eukprot:COSAG05_NODE_2909_length_2518_cov_1.867301_3_plen_122_part_00
MALVNRWAPWWLSVQDFGGGNLGFLGRQELDALPAPLQPLLQHLCEEVEDTAQPEMLARAQAAADRTSWGFGEQNEHPETVMHANAHVRVPIPAPVTFVPPKRFLGPKLQPSPLDELRSKM